MDILYEILDAFHVFIPVVAIVACVIIFVCGIRSSKSAQPPDEYLQEIKNASKNKTRHKTTKLSTQSSGISSSKTDHSPVMEKTTPKSSLLSASAASDASKREKTTKTEPAGVKKPKKLSKKDSDENESLEIVETSEWVTVTPKRKQPQQHGATVATSSSPVHTPTSPDSPEAIGKKFAEEETQEKPIEKIATPKKSPDKKKFAEKPIEKPPVAAELKPAAKDNGENVVVGKEPTAIPETQKPTKTLDEAIEEDESWSVQTGKDSRYRKTKKREGPKNDLIINDGDSFSNSQTVSSSLAEERGSNQQQSSETRRRRNVRREN